MDDSPKPAEDSAHPLQGPHRPDLGGQGVPPLRLVMQPAGPAVDIRRPSVLGRHSDTDIRLALPDVSRRHCRFLFTDGDWYVLDLDSLNGVYVNGHRVRRAPLHHRDRIRLGSITLEVDFADESSKTIPLTGKRPAGSAKVLQSIANALPPADEGPERRRAS